MEGEIRLVPCHDGENCDRIATCPTRPIWVGAATVLEDFFGQTTIAQLAERAKDLDGAPESVAIASGTAQARAEEKGVRP